MNDLSHTKQLAYSQLQKILDDKITILSNEIISIKKSRNSDTKSSAGDKFETGREMMNTELNKNEAQLSKTHILKKNLSQINLLKNYNKIEFGSFVKTNQETFFITIGMGKMKIDNTIYYAISTTSPIGKALQNKTAGDKIQFQDRAFIIEEIA